VYATGSSVDLIKGLGADTVINYREVSIVEEMKGLDLDLVFDTVGGYDGWQAAQGGLKKGGKFISIVGDGGSIGAIIRASIWRNAMYFLGLGASYKIFLTNTKAPEVESDMKKITELVESGSVKPLVDERDFELTTASLGDIIKASMSHRTKGKLVLTVAKV